MYSLDEVNSIRYCDVSRTELELYLEGIEARYTETFKRARGVTYTAKLSSLRKVFIMDNNVLGLGENLLLSIAKTSKSEWRRRYYKGPKHRHRCCSS
jgi:hypothetical protein